MLERDELFSATVDSTFMEREFDSDLRSLAACYVDPDALEEVGRLYSGNVADLYASERPESTPGELAGLREAANEMFVLGFVLACHAMRRKASCGST